jgi:hypothetical protein
VTTDASLERRLASALAVEPPPRVLDALDGRMTGVIERVRAEMPTRLGTARHRRRRRRAVAALAVAAILVGTAASPPVREAFDSWLGGDFASVWDRATTIDQSVVDQGYRVTIVRAYADPVGLYLAMTMEDLEGRDLSEAHVGMPTVHAADGTEFPREMGGAGGTDGSGYSEGLFRYRVPSDVATPGTQRLTAEVTGVSVRAHDPPDATAGFSYESLWTTVPGTWAFTFDLDVFGGLAADPASTASAGGVDVTWTDLFVTPAATIITLQVSGLDATEPDWGWSFGGRIEHDGRDLEWLSSEGILDAGPGPQTLSFEMEQGRDDLTGTWTITIDEFQTDIPDPDSDVTTEKVVIDGPWVLTYEGPAGS